MSRGNKASEIERLCAAIEDKVIHWRREIHQHPELSNREFKTAQLVADHLQQLGFEVQRGVAHTGVIGVLRGRKPSPVIALRADMDALPVTEALDLPFASREKGIYNGKEVGVMHACGHDAHTAILMGVAEVLSLIRDSLPGVVKCIFQPAEEGAPGEEGGASLMIREGALENPAPDAIFALHVDLAPAGRIGWASGTILAAVDKLKIIVRGKQTHGAMPWAGVDPIVVASQIVLGLQTVISRQTNVVKSPAVISIGRIQGGVNGSTIPEFVEMEGTIRTLDPAMREDLHYQIQQKTTSIARSAGATANVMISPVLPITYNDPDLTGRMVAILERVAGKDHVSLLPPAMGGEDFSFYLNKIPGMFFFLGVTPEDADPREIAPVHSPFFHIDERALLFGVRSLVHLAVDFLTQKE